jgi:uncharacterized FlgJ-related protein
MKSFIFLLVLFGVKEISPDLTPTNLVYIKSIEPSLTKEQIITNKLVTCGYSDTLLISLIIAQAKLESGNFTNRLTRHHNNIFSMQHPKKRPTTSLCGCARAENRDGYASFSSIESAVEDYVLYLEFSKITKISTSEEYVRLLKKKKYFESSEKKYLRAITKLMK